MIRRFLHSSLAGLTEITHKGYQMLCKFRTSAWQYHCMLPYIKLLEFSLTEIDLTSDIVKWLLSFTWLFAWKAGDCIKWFLFWLAVQAFEAFTVVDSAKLQYFTVCTELFWTLLTSRFHHLIIQKYFKSQWLFY